MNIYMKAIIGALVAGLGTLSTALTDGGISASEWIAAAITTLTAFGAVYSVPNKDPKAEHQDESVQPPEAGDVDVVTVLVVVALVLLCIFLLGGIR